MIEDGEEESLRMEWGLHYLWEGEEELPRTRLGRRGMQSETAAASVMALHSIHLVVRYDISGSKDMAYEGLPVVERTWVLVLFQLHNHIPVYTQIFFCLTLDSSFAHIRVLRFHSRTCMPNQHTDHLLSPLIPLSILRYLNQRKRRFWHSACQPEVVTIRTTAALTAKVLKAYDSHQPPRHRVAQDDTR